MALLLVSDESGRERWIAYVDDLAGQVYVFVANTGTFHRNDAVGVDYYADQRLSYVSIDADTAVSRMAAGLGRIDERTADWLVDRFRRDSQCRTVESVLGRRVAVPLPTSESGSGGLDRGA